MAEYAQKHGFQAPNLIRSGGGAFEIRKNGFLLFSKLAEHRFPSESEVVELLKDTSK